MGQFEFYYRLNERAKHYFVRQEVKYRWDSLSINIDLTNAPKIVSEYDQEIPQSQTADNPVAPRGRAAQPSRDLILSDQRPCIDGSI